MREEHSAVSADQEAQMQGWEHVLDDVEHRRGSLTGQPKLRLTLDFLPESRQCIRFDERTHRTVTGADCFDEAVVFQGSMERLMNARMEAGGGVMEWLAGPASYLDVQFKQIAGQLGYVHA